MELEHKCIAEDGARENYRREKEEPPRKFSEGLEKPFTDSNKLLKRFENTDFNTKRFALIERNVHVVLSAYKAVYDEKNKSSKPE